MRTGFIYFIKRSDGPIKIGFSTHPERRLFMMNKQDRRKPYTMIEYFPAYQCVEGQLHELLQHLRLGREWFKDDDWRPALLEMMTELLVYDKIG